MCSATLLATLLEIQTLLDEESDSPRIGELIARAIELGLRVEERFAAVLEEYRQLSLRQRHMAKNGVVAGFGERSDSR